MKHFDTGQYPQGFEVLASTKRSQAAMMTLERGGVEGGPENKHDDADQWLYVISGAGAAIVEGKQVPLEAGSLVLIAAGERHEIRCGNKAPLVTLNFYAPPEY